MPSRGLDGVRRSLRLYHGSHAPRAAMDRLYGRFIAPGDLVFDIGAHVGDRISSFRRLGARVVAAEPQPRLMRVLRLIHGRDADVSLVAAAVGAVPGAARMLINTDNPTVSTLSESFVATARDADGWREQTWDDAVSVPVTTLDDLLAQYGVPRFIKIDVEGGEADVLRGLTTPPDALSFEFTTMSRHAGLDALDCVSALGGYVYAYALGETQALNADGVLDVSAMRERLLDLPDAANSGDVYAWRPECYSGGAVTLTA